MWFKKTSIQKFKNGSISWGKKPNKIDLAGDSVILVLMKSIKIIMIYIQEIKYEKADYQQKHGNHKQQSNESSRT